MRKVLIANRGEIACRIIRSCRSVGLESVAVYSDADASCLHTEMADDARHLGGANPRDSYLNAEKILAAATDAGADAIHPGYGFLAENPEFAAAVQDAGLIWIGPTPQSISDMGDKERARKIAAAAGAPILPGSERLCGDDVDSLTRVAEKVGYPLLIKASAGGGGIGMRKIDSPAQLADAAAATITLAARAFGNGDIFFERFVSKARHVEVQIFGFGDGQAVHFFERECSIQRRFQKVIEEAPSPGVSPALREKMCAAAVALAKSQSYAGAGTVEFVMDDESDEFFFLEMNTRIQVEHPVTEMICGVDLVNMQLRQAAGAPVAVKQEDIAFHGHAIECRVYAENPQKMFLPSPGKLDELTLPTSADNIRVDCGFRRGELITPHYDPMIAKIITRGDTRAQSIATMADVLQNARINGVASNLHFLARCMEHPDFIAGNTTTDFIERRLSDLV